MKAKSIDNASRGVVDKEADHHSGDTVRQHRLSQRIERRARKDGAESGEEPSVHYRLNQKV